MSIEVYGIERSRVGAKGLEGDMLRNMVRHFWSRTGFLFGNFFVALVIFIVMIALLSLSLGVAVIFVGVLLGAATLLMAKGIAVFYRSWLSRCGYVFDAEDIETRVAHDIDKKGQKKSWIRRCLGIYAQPRRWREVLFSVVNFALGIASWVIVVVWWAISLNGLTYWFWQRFLPPDSDIVCINGCRRGGLVNLLNLPISNALLFFFFSIVTIVTIVPLTNGLATMCAGVARVLLNPTRHEKMADRVRQVERSRQLAAAAQTKDLQQIEHDLHDGPQQKLVRLGMDLATAQRRLRQTDSEGTAELLAEARGRVDEILAEIRQISRSVAPPSLVELGLAAAIESLAATSPIPASVDAQQIEMGQAQATAVYFAIAESSANAAKYSGAKHIAIKLGALDGGVAVVATVRDDGRGGAVIIPGHGLAGLQNRLAGVDGTLEVMSSSGMGTLVRIIVPVGSKD